MSFDRQCELIFRSPLSRVGDTWTWEETPITGLDFSFSAHRSRVFNDNYAEVTLYNASPATRNNILRAGSNLLINAGYADTGKGLIFLGNIVEVRHSIAGPDTISTISAASMRSQEKPFQVTPVAFSFAEDTPLSTVLDGLGNVMGLALVGRPLANIPLPGGWTYAGTIRGAFEYCGKILRAQGLGLYVDLAELIVFRLEGESEYEAIYLSYDSGLLSVKDITESAGLTRETIQAILEDGNEAETYSAIADNMVAEPRRLEVESILLPRARPNGLIQLKSDFHSGVFLIDTLEFKGDNMGGDYTCSMEVVEE